MCVTVWLKCRMGLALLSYSSVRKTDAHWNTAITSSVCIKLSLFPRPRGRIKCPALGSRGIDFALWLVAPSPKAQREGRRRFPWRWHPINHSKRFSSGSCRVTVDRWTRGREGRTGCCCCCLRPTDKPRASLSGQQPLTRNKTSW